ncbi:unnamed protein product [Pleuronectes platessa]|uniref:Uncharacterized protein n=1 Tax=Pleuronectes platessa TaxID=8262 RepID=A0A9N7VN88_PLEPL|nr:unnamed protein product [Pleuronectes platessa]
MERKPRKATKWDVMSEKPGSEHSLIESFFKEMTVEQFQLMTSSEPDGATRTRLAELLLELLACGSRAVVKNLDHGVVVVMEENVRSIVGDPILFSFGVVMNDKEVDLLRTLLVEEFVKRVNAILQNIMFSERIASQGPAPHRLNTMMDLTCHLFSVFRLETLGLKPFRPSYQKNRVTEDIQPVRSGRLDVASAIFVIISKQAEKISAPLLNNVQDRERSQLKSQTSLEIQKVSDKLSLRHRRAASQRGAGKIEVLLSVHFIRALLYHIMEQINTKFHLGRRLQTLPLFSVTDALLGQVTDRGEKHIDYVNEFWSLKNAFSGKDQDFVFELFHVICRCTAPHKSDAEICEEAWHKVQYSWA